MVNAGVIQHQDHETVWIALFEHSQKTQERRGMGSGRLMKHRFAIVDVDRAKQRYVGMMAERRHLFLVADFRPCGRQDMVRADMGFIDVQKNSIFCGDQVFLSDPFLFQIAFVDPDFLSPVCTSVVSTTALCGAGVFAGNGNTELLCDIGSQEFGVP